MAKKLSSEAVKKDERVEDVVERQREEFREEAGSFAVGEVEVGKSVTIQVEQYHPIVTSMFVRLPIEPGETAGGALRRVRAVIEEELTDAVADVINDGLKPYQDAARRKR